MKAVTSTDVAGLFLEHSRKKLFGEWWPRLRSTVEGLSNEQLWWRPNEASNSIGNLLLHLNGNVRQWMVASFNRQEDRRDRPSEFAEKAGETAGAVLARLGATMDQAAAAFHVLTSDRRVEVVVGPAGAGKTRVLAGIGRAWAHGRVVGITPSQKAPLKLRDPAEAQEMQAGASVEVPSWFGPPN